MAHAYECECGAFIRYDRKEELFRDIVDTFLRERVRGVTCRGCNKIRRADVYIRAAESVEGLADVEYNVKGNKWLERDNSGKVYEGQPPVLSIESAYIEVMRRGITAKRERRKALLLRLAHASSIKKTASHRKKPHGKVYLKPWKDPDSLFCSPKLESIVGKKLSTGEECKDKR